MPSLLLLRRVRGSCLLAFCAALAARPCPGQTTAPSSDVQSSAISRQKVDFGSSATDFALENARREMGARHFEAARADLDSFLRDHSKSPEGLYLLGETLLRQNHPQESLGVFTKAAAVRAPSADELRLVAFDYVLLNDYPDAVRWLERSVQLAPANAESWYALGRARYTTGDFAGAETDFIKSLSFAPKSVKAEDNLGLAYVAEGKSQMALDAYQRGIEAQQTAATKSEQPLLNYGTLLTKLGKTKEAEKPLAEAVAIAPTCATCHEAFSTALLVDQHLPEATAQMEAAVHLDADNPRYHYELARIYKQAGDRAKADIEFNKSAKLYGSHATAPN